MAENGKDLNATPDPNDQRDPTPAPPKTYGWARLYEVDLPSGTVVVLRPVNVLAMVKAGQLPKELAGMSLELAQASMRGKGIDYERLSDYYRALLSQCMARPTLDEVGFDNIPEGDMAAIQQWLLGNRSEGSRRLEATPAELAPFRAGAGRVALGSPGEAVRPATE